MHQRITRAITTVIRNWLKDLAVLRDACLLTQIVRAAAEDQVAVGIVIAGRWSKGIPPGDQSTAIVDLHSEVIDVVRRRRINFKNLKPDVSLLGLCGVVINNEVTEVV